MSDSIEPDDHQKDTVVQQVLNSFFAQLAQTKDLIEISQRLKKATNYTEASIRSALYGEEST